MKGFSKVRKVFARVNSEQIEYILHLLYFTISLTQTYPEIIELLILTEILRLRSKRQVYWYYARFES